MSSKFEHGHATYNGYKMVDKKIRAVNEAGEVDESVKVYDISLYPQRGADAVGHFPVSLPDD
jgi:hypothetical protein